MLVRHFLLFFFFNDTATTEIYTLSLHELFRSRLHHPQLDGLEIGGVPRRRARRSEEHTSELQSRRDLVCRLLLEKKKNNQIVPVCAYVEAGGRMLFELVFLGSSYMLLACSLAC